MEQPQSVNWTLIQQTCPQLNPNAFDVLLALLSLTGCILNTILFIRFHRQRKHGTTFLGFLAGFDIIICSHYLFTFSFTSLIMAFRIDFLAELRIETQTQMKPFLAFYEGVMAFILLFIIVERFLWTFHPRIRQKWKMFIDARPKFSLSVGAAVYILVSVLTTYYPGVELSNVPFCDVAFRPVEFKNPSLRCIQLYVFPLIIFLATIATLVFAVLTVFKLPNDKGKEPVPQEEIKLASPNEERPTISTNQVKRSIICMLLIYATFLIRAILYYVFMDPLTSSMFIKSIGSRVSTTWWYDLISMLFSGSRYVLSYLICKDQIISEYHL